MPNEPIVRRAVHGRWQPRVWAAAALATALGAAVAAAAADPAGEPARADAPPSPTKPEAGPSAATGKEGSPAAESKGGKSSFAAVVKDATAVPGLVPLWRKDDKVYADLPDRLLGKDFFVLISIARGIGDRLLLGGMSLGFGDDWVWQFRKVNDTIHVVRRNVRFFAAQGSPEEKAVDLAYTDSVLFSVPILATSPGGGHLVDLGRIFLTDLPQIARQLPGFSFAADRSTWARVKGFPDNVELEVSATYGSSGAANIDTVPDSRGATLIVHYSLSLLPQNSYVPRLADDRVGYFVTALKDFSQKVDEDRFVRYVNRWHLQKADPAVPVSPPKKPIVFWIERTVPFRYRPAIRAGIEAWNEAFERAGFSTAIEVRQQADVTDWDPEDVNYNTFRWITAGQSFAMGPSRVNPRTGQILDADIIFDGDFLQFWRTEYETFTPRSVALLTGGGPAADAPGDGGACPTCAVAGRAACRLFAGHARETALAATSLAAGAESGLSEADKERLVTQGLKLVAMHEVGHTLGLRHNFKGSSIGPTAGDATPAHGSVMDYLPANIAPRGVAQGDFYPAGIGPYDVWAIEYGYRPLAGGSPAAELPELEKIAARSGEPALAYATDEDCDWGDPDPLVNRFDLGADPLEFARTRADLVAQAMPLIAARMTRKDAAGKGGGYERVRQAFGVLLAAHGQALDIAARLVGGLETSRSHAGDADARPPFRVVPAARQRAALDLVERRMFAAEPFTFPPELYNQLVATRWRHWGSDSPGRDDYPVHEAVLLWQDRVLARLLDPLTLERIRDAELKVPAAEDVLTTAELLERVTRSVTAEVDALGPGDWSPRKPAIASLRRGLQRSLVTRLSRLAIGATDSNPDAQALAAAQLRSLDDRIGGLLDRKDVRLDEASRAHLVETRARIGKVLDASLQLPRP